MTKSAKQLILVDDDPINIFLSRVLLEEFLNEDEIMDFIIPEKALEFIKTEFVNIQKKSKTVLFLDINMPTLTGWEFLDKFSFFADPIKNQFDIYMLSSSINPADIQRAKLNPLVVDFIEKPFNEEILVKIFG